MQLGVHNLEVGGCGNVASAHPTLATDLKPHLGRAVVAGTDAHLLHVEEELGDLFLHVGQRGILVEYAVDLNPSDGVALHGTEQHSSQGIADGNGKAPLQWLHCKLSPIFP